MSASAFKR